METKTKKLHRAWIIFGALCVYYFIAYGLLYSSFGIFLTPMSKGLNIPYVGLSFTPTIRVLCGAAVTGFMAKLYRKINLRLFLSMTIICLAGTIFLLTLTTQLFQILILYGLIGVFCGFNLYSIIPILLNQWFKAPAALISITMAFGGAGGVIICPIITTIINNHGWQMGYYIMAAGVMVIMLPIAALLLDYSPASKNLEPSEGIRSKKVASNTMSYAAKIGTVYNFPNYLMCAIFFFFGSLSSGMYVHINSALISKEFDPIIIAFLISCFQFGNMVFQFLPGFVSAWTGPAVVICVSVPLIVIGAVSTIFITPSTSIVVVAISIFLLGGSRMFTSFNSVFARYIFGNQRFDDIYPKLHMCSLVGTALSSIIYGTIYTLFGSYTGALVLTSFCVIIGLIITVILCTRVGEKKSKKLPS